MPSTTNGYPYPAGTDRLADGNEAMQALAEAVDAKAGVRASGTAVIPSAALGTVVPLAVTFPAGRFSVAPLVETAALVSNPERAHTSCENVTATGFTLNGCRTSGTVSDINANWHARSAAGMSGGYPYPAGSDQVTDGDNVLQSLAEKADAQVGLKAAGFFTWPAWAGGIAVAAITFPAGRFPTPPAVALSAQSGIAHQRRWAPSNVTATGFTANAYYVGGSGATLSGYWLARLT
jgi:hypothetical protein